MPQTRPEPHPDVVRRVADVAAGLPEAYQEDAWTGVRWRIRSQTFAHVLVAGGTGSRAYVTALDTDDEVALIAFHATGDELLALTHAGPPFFKTPYSTTSVAMVLPDDPAAVDWVEVAELVTESYRARAPQKLVRLLG